MSAAQETRCHALEQIAETKRILLAVEHALGPKAPLLLLISSATRAEGKSLVAAALAATAASMGRRPVLALDLNWYQPALHEFFGVTLATTVAAHAFTDLAELVRPSGRQGLDILPAPVDHRTHERLPTSVFELSQRLLDQAAARYHWVVVDAAPVFPTNRLMMDPVMLATLVDGVALVVASATTPRHLVKKAQKTLEGAGARLLGVIANQCPGPR